MCNVLIAGGGGFIGTVLVAQLRHAGHAVTVMGRNVILQRNDVRVLKLPNWHGSTVESIEEWPQYDWVFNLAAYGVNPGETDEEAARHANTVLPVVLARLAKRAGALAFVHTGSMFEYAESAVPRRLLESDPLEQTKVYGRTKAAGSCALVETAAKLGLNAVVARVFGVYGEGERPWRLLPTIFGALSAGRSVPLTAGQQVRDLMYVSDVADGLMALAQVATAQPEPHVVNLCTGVVTSVRQFAEAVADAMGASHSLLQFGEVPMRAHEAMYLAGDPSRLHSTTDWRPHFDLEAGVAAACKKLSSEARAD